MKNILHLANPKLGNINYKVIKFPDGQQDIVLEALRSDMKEVEIKSHMNSFLDIELIICAKRALDQARIKRVHLYTPYLLGARSDRKFYTGDKKSSFRIGNSYLRDVIAPIINSLNFKSVTVYDPHSSVMDAVIHNLIVMENGRICLWALYEIKDFEKCKINDLILIAPDKGAEVKTYDIAAFIGCDKVITASKKREITTGQITETIVPLIEDHEKSTYVMIDDICDGGRTFIEIAKKLPKEAKVYLIVTHGIFSAGFDELLKYFKRIYTTNSIRTLELNENYPDFVKQFNLF